MGLDVKQMNGRGVKMTIECIKRHQHGLLFMALAAMMLLTSGCFSIRNPFGPRQKRHKGLEVMPVTNTEVLELSYDDIANIIIGLGMLPDDREEGMAFAEDLHQALMFRGMARIRRDGEWIAQFRIAGDRVRISVIQGAVIYYEYDAKTHQWTQGPQSTTMQMPGQQMFTQPPQMGQPNMMIPQSNNTVYPPTGMTPYPTY